MLDRRPRDLVNRVWDDYFHRSVLAVVLVLGPVEAWVIALVLRLAGVVR